MRRASGHNSPMLIPGRAAIGRPTDTFRLCLVHQLKKAVDRRPILLLQRIPHLKPPSKKLPGPVPVLRVDGCSRLGFKPICGIWPPFSTFSMARSRRKDALYTPLVQDSHRVDASPRASRFGMISRIRLTAHRHVPGMDGIGLRVCDWLGHLREQFHSLLLAHWRLPPKSHRVQ